MSRESRVDLASHREMSEAETSGASKKLDRCVQRHAGAEQSQTKRTAGLNGELEEPTLEKLLKRRASASPEGFNHGGVKPLPVESVAVQTGGPISKKQRTDGNSEHKDSERCLPTTAFPRQSGTAHKQKQFNIINAFLKRPELLKHLVSWLTVPSLLALYSISKPFHVLFNQNETSFILACVQTWAPGSEHIYPWRCYRTLCDKDPHQRRSDRWIGKLPKKQWQDLRDVPSLRWLQMVIWRHAICKDMLVQLATKGLLCPPGTLDAIKRMWFMLDLPLNSQRLSLMHSKTYITNDAIELMMLFLLKVDMHFTDPVPPSFHYRLRAQCRWPDYFAGGLVSGVTLRKTLLAEQHLTPLWRVIRGWTWDPDLPQVAMTRLDIIRLWVRHYYHPQEDLPVRVKRQSIMRIPWWEVGTASLERAGVGYFDFDGKRHTVIDPSIIGPEASDSNEQRRQLEKKHEMLYPHRRRIVLAHEKPRQKLLRPDELLIGESIARQLRVHTKWVDMMFYGFCDDYGNDIPLRTEEEYLRM